MLNERCQQIMIIMEDFHVIFIMDQAKSDKAQNCPTKFCIFLMKLNLLRFHSSSFFELLLLYFKRSLH